MAFRFLHAADLHLDTPFQGIGRAQPAIAEALRDASLQALDALVDHAIDTECDLVLLAGDIYDGAVRGLRAQLRLHAATERLTAAGIRVCMVHGNHDPVDEGWSAIAAWPEGVTVFGVDEVEQVAFTARDATPVVVHGISYAESEQTENLARRFPRVGDEAFHIALLHASVGHQPEHAPYSPCALEDLVATGHHYWALGHIHRAQVLRERPHVVYPGNLQGRSFKPSEQGPKGAALVTVDAGQVTLTPVPLDAVRFVEVDVDVSDDPDVAAVMRRLIARTEALRAEHAGRGLLLRARLIGDGGPTDDLLRPGSARELLEELRGSCADLAPFTWWARLTVEVGEALDLDALRAGDDLAATVVATADRLAAGGLDLERTAPTQVAGFVPPNPDAILDAALRDALIRLRS